MKKYSLSFFVLSLLLFTLPFKCKDSVYFFKPNHSWAISVPFKGFLISQKPYQFEKDCLKVEAYNEKEKIILNIYFDIGTPNVEPKKVREYYENILKGSDFKIEILEKWEKENCAYLIYKAKEVILGDPPKDELNGSLYSLKGTTWIDVRFRIQTPQEGDTKKIKDYLSKVKIVDSFEPSIEDALFMGNIYCAAGLKDYCLSLLKTAYEKEKRFNLLKKEPLISLIYNLSEALRLTGERDKAMEVLNYGIQRIGDYPMFYWVKARIYADLGDEDKTLLNIKLAVDNIKNLLEGEKLPDPRQDEAFKFLGQKESFRQRITQIFFPEGYKKEEKSESQQ